jgi:rod shape-determining protein MreC
MRNLIRFILNNHFFILFIFFEIVALTLVFQNNNYQKAFVFNLSRNISGYADSRILSFRQYLYLYETNKALMEDNTWLRNNLISSFKQKMLLNANAEFDSVWAQQYNFIPVRVISNSTNKQNNFISIDKGAAHGVKTDMAVVSHDGVVGVITGVSANFATVMPILNIDLRISSKIKNTGYFGSLHWDGRDPGSALLHELPHHVTINTGDTIITSGYSAIFPEGIMVGTIAEFELKGANFYTVVVDLSTNFRRLNHIWVIEDLFREEFLELQRKAGYD